MKLLLRLIVGTLLATGCATGPVHEVQRVPWATSGPGKGWAEADLARYAFEKTYLCEKPPNEHLYLVFDTAWFCLPRYAIGHADLLLLLASGLEPDLTRFAFAYLKFLDDSRTQVVSIMDLPRVLRDTRLGEVAGLVFVTTWASRRIRDGHVVYFADEFGFIGGVHEQTRFPTLDTVFDARRAAGGSSPNRVVLLVAQPDKCLYRSILLRDWTQMPPLVPYSAAVLLDSPPGRVFSLVGEVLTSGTFEYGTTATAPPIAPFLAHPLRFAPWFAVAVDSSTGCATSVVPWPREDDHLTWVQAPGTTSSCGSTFSADVFFFPPTTSACRVWDVEPPSPPQRKSSERAHVE